MAFAWGILKTLAAIALLLLAAIFLVRAWQAMRGPPLELWHSYVPDEPSASEIGEMDWKAWIASEDLIMQQVSANVSDRLPEHARIPQNRFWKGSPMNPERLERNWNRSFELSPEGQPVGAAVMLHGLSDSPYSLRHIAEHYRSQGFAVVAIRLPGHGTVPAGLTKAGVAQWQAATRLAVREAMRLAPGKPLHMVGYSNGAALAVAHAAEAAEDPALGMPSQVVLFSPMVGLTPFARFTGLAAMPAVFPAFVKAAWLDNIAEYNPFKYNSFPVKAGAEAHRLTELLSSRLAHLNEKGLLDRMPPVLGFQSVLDSTVSASAVVSGLYDRLPSNGSELVLVDINHAAYVGPLIRPSATEALGRLLPKGPRAYRVTVITNDGGEAGDTVVRSIAPDALDAQQEAIDIAYPREIYSLGHVALPFPVTDGLYGSHPDPADQQGVTLGGLAFRGETGALSVSPATLARISCNPFLSWMLGRIDATLPIPAAGIPAADGASTADGNK